MKYISNWIKIIQIYYTSNFVKVKYIRKSFAEQSREQSRPFYLRVKSDIQHMTK